MFLPFPPPHHNGSEKASQDIKLTHSPHTYNFILRKHIILIKTNNVPPLPPPPTSPLLACVLDQTQASIMNFQRTACKLFWHISVRENKRSDTGIFLQMSFRDFSPKIPPILKLDVRKVFKIFCRNMVNCLFIN